VSRLLWSFEAGAMLGSSPALGPDGSVFVGSRAGRLHAVDAAGAERWRFEAGGAMEAGPCVHPAGLVLAGSYDGQLYAIDLDGALAWKHDAGHPVMTTPCVDAEGTIWVGDDGGTLWQLSAQGEVLSRRVVADLIATSPVVAGGTVLVADGDLLGADGSVVALGVDTVVAPAAVGADGTVYLGSWSGELLAVRDGAVVWRHAVGAQVYAGCSVAADGRVLVTTRRGHVVAVSAQGERLWSRVLPNGVYGTPAIARDGLCFVGCNDSRLRALSLATGEIVWKERCGRDLRSSPLLTPEGRVIVSCWDYELYCFEGGAGGPAEGAPWAQFHGGPARLGRRSP